MSADGNSNSPADESSSNVEPYSIKATLKWSIANFMRQAATTEKGESLLSPLFNVGDFGPHCPVFQLQIFPNGDITEEDLTGYVSLFLCRRNNWKDLEVKYSFSVLKANNKECFWRRVGPYTAKFNEQQHIWGYPKAFSKDRIFERSSESLPGGKLTVLCNLEMMYPAQQSKGRKPLEFRGEMTASLVENMKTAFTDRAFPDFSIICGERTFACHKFILSSCSDVFAAMFSHDTAENQEGKVVINDVEPDVLDQFLRFIYTDSCKKPTPSAPICHYNPLPSGNTNSVSDLYILADKYNLPRLRSMCEEFLCKQVDEENVSNLLIMSHLHNAKQLWRFALDFVLGHVKEFTSSAGFKVLSQSHPDIMALLFEAKVAKK